MGGEKKKEKKKNQTKYHEKIYETHKNENQPPRRQKNMNYKYTVFFFFKRTNNIRTHIFGMMS